MVISGRLIVHAPEQICARMNEVATEVAAVARAEKKKAKEEATLLGGAAPPKKTIAGACTDNPTCAHSFCR